MQEILIGISTGKRPLGSLRRRWEDNIRMDLKEIGIYERTWHLIGSGLSESPCECEIEPLGSMSLGVS